MGGETFSAKNNVGGEARALLFLRRTCEGEGLENEASSLGKAKNGGRRWFGKAGLGFEWHNEAGRIVSPLVSVKVHTLG